MYALFRYGHKAGVMSAGGVYALWLLLIDQTSVIHLNAGTGAGAGVGIAMNIAFLLVGTLLLFRSYIRSRNLQTGAAQGGTRP